MNAKKSLIFCLSILGAAYLLNPHSSFAKETESVINSSEEFDKKIEEFDKQAENFDKIFLEEIGKEVYVKHGLKIPRETLVEIASQSKNAIVTFHNYKENDFKKNNYESRGSRTHVIRDHFVRNVYRNKKILASVARGASYSLQKNISINQSNSVSGSVGADILSVARANLSASYGNGVSQTITVGRVFNGPANGSSANSRTYYCAVNTRIGYLKIKKVGAPNSSFKKVDYEVPLNIVEWSEDVNI